MSTTTKKELIDRIAKSTQAKQTLVKVIIQNFLDEIISELAKGNRLEFRDFGIFETKTRGAGTAQNSKTMKRIHVPSRRVVRSRIGRLMKQRQNGRNKV